MYTHNFTYIYIYIIRSRCLPAALWLASLLSVTTHAVTSGNTHNVEYWFKRGYNRVITSLTGLIPT